MPANADSKLRRPYRTSTTRPKVGLLVLFPICYRPPMSYRFAGCELDPSRYHLSRAGDRIEIEPKAFDVLVYLLRHRDRMVAKDELLDKLWPGQVVGEAALTRCVGVVRKAVGDDRTKQAVIETQHGRGYRFIATVTEQNEAASPRSSSDGTGSVSVTSNGQSSDVILVPLPLPHGQETNEHAVSVAPAPVQVSPSVSPVPVAAEEKRGEMLPPPRRQGDARWLFTILILLTGLVVAVRYLPFSLIHPRSLTPDIQPLSLPNQPSIVILPFLNLTGDPNQEILGDGIVEGVTTGLAKLPGLFVIRRTSAFTYKGKAVQARDVSRELGVRYVLEGSVQKVANDHIRVTARLIDATTDQLVWAEEYDRPVKDIFAVRDDITRKLVTHVAPKVTAVEQAILERTYAGNLEAYNYFVRGSFSWQHGGDKEKNAEGRQLCQKAVEIDPSYAHAYACMGFTYWFDWLYGWTQDPQALEHLLASAHQALALDDSLSPAHELVGVYYVAKREYERALPELQRAIELGPNWSSPYAMLGIALNATGRAAEAIPLLEHAVRLAPRHPVWTSAYLATLGNAYRLTGQYDKAIETLKKAMSMNPGLGGAPLYLIATYSEAGHDDLAKALAEQILRKNPQFSLAAIQQRASFIYKDPADFERFLAALRKAGLK